MNYKRIIVLGLMALLAACQAPMSANSQESAGLSQPAKTSQPESAMDSQAPRAVDQELSTISAGHALQSELKPGMAYADFRERVLARGWVPVVDAQCKVNVVGGNHETLCAENPDLISCQVCDQMPELNACSGDGHCLVRFRHAGAAESLEATGYGMIEDWKVSGEESRLQVSQWSFSKDPPR